MDDVFARIMDSDKWPNLELPENLELQNEMADESFATLIKSVKDGTSNVEQIFILTHNVFFHKEASFVNGRTNPEPTVNFWVLKKNDSMTLITPYGIKNPISTSYELLWQELKNDQPSSIITTQNTMRRIIENYFGMLGGAKEDYIVEKFDTIEDQMICRSLFHWINDGL